MTCTGLADRVAASTTLLFVPGDRPERFAKAEAAGADMVILDLEDAVAPEHKDAARDHVCAWLNDGHECVVRVNAADTRWHIDDLAAVTASSCAVMLPKADEETAHAATELTPHVIALIETASGVLGASAIAAVPGVQRLALGTFDLAAQLGVDPNDRDALAAARGGLVLASAAATLPGPIDGVTANLDDEHALVSDVGYARRMGFLGKLCVHPRQVSPAAAALRPSAAEVSWAQSIIEATNHGGVVVINGQMIDKPVLDRTHRILRRAANNGKHNERSA
ncbi:CoA ester lyase [Skermania sp. ID1734]|nr:CoA ester lyase [Skermania sp. ID1734]